MNDEYYYRSQLTPTEKRAYDEVVFGIQKMEQRITLPMMKAVSVRRTLHAVHFDRPELFYFDYYHSSFSYAPDGSIPPHVDLRYTHTKEEIRRCQLTIGINISKALQTARKLTKATAAEYLHDWLIGHSVYMEQNDIQMRSHSIVGALIDGKCVCEGFALAYLYLTRLCGVSCLAVRGVAGISREIPEPHAWNIVTLNGKSYQVDVTFDHLNGSRLNSNERESGKPKEKPYCSKAFFCLSDQEMYYDHIVEQKNNFHLPTCPESGSRLHKVKGTVELLRFLEKECAQKKRTSEVRITKGFTAEKIMEMIHSRLTPKDYLWFSKVNYFMLGQKKKSVFVVWKDE